MNLNRTTKHILITSSILILIILFSTFKLFRFDLSEEKTHSISPISKNILTTLYQPVDVTIYLEGNLDMNLVRLKKATTEMLDELAIYAKEPIRYRFINPTTGNDAERNHRLMMMEQRGLKGMSISHQDNQGNFSQSVVYPWAEVIVQKDTMAIALLQPSGSGSGESTVNEAIEQLEFKFIDAIRCVSSTEIKKIAFIEGHGELNEIETWDMTTGLSRYFQIDRGVLGNDPHELDEYAAIIVANPQEKYSESEKFIIDQYIMRGGNVLWLISGVQYSTESLSKSGISPVLPLDVNLQDMLFKYGIRIAPSLVLDQQCALIPMNIAPTGQTPQFKALPWYYAPLLLTSPYNPITKNVPAVKGEFSSVIEIVNDDSKIKKDLLLISSNASHLGKVPGEINLEALQNIDQKQFFHSQYLPVAVLLEGQFTSLFQNRMPPQEIISEEKPIPTSKHTRMIVVANGNMMTNEVSVQDNGYAFMPLGFDRASNQTFGNKNFFINALQYLTDDYHLMQLRNRTITLRQLNKALISNSATSIKWINTLIPLCCIFLIALTFFMLRKRRYQN